MSKKKYLTKNEFRLDLNPAHFGRKKEPHPAYITARYGHKFRANTITHSRRTTDGFKTHDVYENPDKFSKDKRPSRVGPPFWQKDTYFSEKKLDNFRFSKSARTRIKNINKKFK